MIACSYYTDVLPLCILHRNTTTEPWWLQRTDYQFNKDSNQSLEKDCNHSGSYDIEEKNEKQTARFTEYSMTSSVVPRSEGGDINNSIITVLMNELYS